MADPSELSERLVEGMTALQAVAGELPPEEALDVLDEAALQLFWREWPDMSSWAGALWRRLDSELGPPAAPTTPGLPEIGGEG